MRYVWPRLIADNLYEFVFLDGYPNKVETNSHDPPNSFYSKDMFSPHPSIANAWKYEGRLDDRVTLLNGEKILPLPSEGLVKREHLVREAVVFGIGRSVPGLLLFRADDAKHLSDDDFVDRVWHTIKEANRNSEGFAQIGRDMVIPISADVQYPQADKGSIIRAQIYKMIESEIDEAYYRLEGHREGSLKLDILQMEEHLLQIGRKIIGSQLKDKHTNFFSAGMNSLQAIHMRGSAILDLDLGGNGKRVGQNVVFEAANVADLANHLHRISLGQELKANDTEIAMESMIQKYSGFRKHKPSLASMPKQQTVVG